MGFISIYTPTFRRPRLLQRCIASVQAQTIYPAEVEHIIWRDEVGVGIGGMFKALAENVRGMANDYGYILQDDDRLAAEDVCARVQTFARQAGYPEIIMVRNRKAGQVQPLGWEEAPVCGRIDLGSYIVRRDVLQAFAHEFGQRYEGDYDFIAAVWRAGKQFTWCDLIFAEAQAHGLGRSEADLWQDEASIDPQTRRELRAL